MERDIRPGERRRDGRRAGAAGSGSGAGSTRELKVPVVLWGIALLQVVMAVVAFLADWPAQFATDGTSPAGVFDWLVKGSAVSAPLPFILVLVAVGAMAARRGALGLVGDGLAVLVAVVLVVASLGETFAPDPVTAPRGVLVASGVLGVVLAVAVLGAVARDVRLRRRSGS